MSRTKTILIIALLSVIVVAGFSIYILKNGMGVACTVEAKLCLDGSYVGRQGPNCEFAKCPSEDGDALKTGVIAGKITIGPLCPVEPCQDSIRDVYSSRQVVLIPMSFGDSADNALPVYIKINDDGTYKGEAKVNYYQLSLTDCNFLSCHNQFPRIVKINADQTLIINIDIDTGIR